MEIFDFELTEEEMKAIDELTKRQIRIGGRLSGSEGAAKGRSPLYLILKG